MKTKLKIIITALFYYPRTHPVITFISILLTAACIAAGYAAIRYPDDRSFIEKTIAGDNKSAETDQEQILDVITENVSLSIIPAYTKETSEKISILQSSGYMKSNPYSDSQYIFRYVTGRTGLWIDEKNSVLLPCGSSMRFSSNPSDGSRIEFHIAAVSFTEKKAARNIELKVLSDGKIYSVLSQQVEIYDRKEFLKSQKSSSSSFPGIYPSTGWHKVTADISKFKGKRITVEISSSDREGFIFIGNPVHYARSQQKKYNVVHIVFDAMNRDYMGIYNPESPLTPNFNKLKDDFIIFDKFYSNATKTRIFLSGMLTSQNPPATRHGYNRNIIPEEDKNLFYSDKSIDTLPQAMQRNGYLTMQVGNSGFTHPALQIALDYGFSESFDFQKMPYDSTGIAYHLIRTLRERKNSPMYIYTHFNTTHEPRKTPLKYYFKGFFGMPDKIWRPNVTGATVHADALFLQITEALKKEGLWDNTIVIVSSDHGTLYHASNYNRNYLVEDFIRIPFMIHLPSELKKKYADGMKRFESATGFINLAPTILDLTGSLPSSKFKGKSIVPFLKMDKSQLYTDEFIRSFDSYSASIIYKGRWKYVQIQDTPFSNNESRTLKWYFFGSGPADPSEALYDLENDPLEKNNIIGQQRDIVTSCRKAFPDGSRHPALNMITVYPDGKNNSITIRSDLKSRVIRAGILKKNETDTFHITNNQCEFKISVTDTPRYIYFEGEDSDAPFSMQVISNGKPLRDSSFLCGSYNLPLVKQNTPIEGINLLSALLITAKPAAPEFQEGVAVNLSRMDIRRWVKENRGTAEAGMDSNMKQVLKSWGYIQ